MWITHEPQPGYSLSPSPSPIATTCLTSEGRVPQVFHPRKRQQRTSQSPLVPMDAATIARKEKRHGKHQHLLQPQPPQDRITMQISTWRRRSSHIFSLPWVCEHGHQSRDRWIRRIEGAPQQFSRPIVDKWYRRRNRSHCRWKSCQRREIRFGNDTFHPHVSYSQGQERHLYVKVVVIDKPNKEIKQRAGFTAGGVKSVYTGENCSTKSADLTSAKKNS